jgi:hypothetical protein
MNNYNTITMTNSLENAIEKLILSCQSCNSKRSNTFNIFYLGREISCEVSHYLDFSPGGHYFDCVDGEKRSHNFKIILFINNDQVDWKDDLQKIMNAFTKRKWFPEYALNAFS